jgi:hypothetical protein
MVVGVFVGGIMGFVHLVKTLFDDPAGKDRRDDPEEDDGPDRRPR